MIYYGHLISGLIELLSKFSANMRLLSPLFSELSDTSQGKALQSSDLPYCKSHMQNVSTDKAPRSWPSVVAALGSTEHGQNKAMTEPVKQTSCLMTAGQAPAECHKCHEVFNALTALQKVKKALPALNDKC
jgi:hypothetical protein